VTVVLVVAVALVSWFGWRSSTPVSTTTTATSTTEAPVPANAVWPTAASGVRYLTASAAAQGLATDLLHMATPLVEAVSAGANGSRVALIRPSARGPVTTVSLRSSSDGTWWVWRATTPDIVVTTPAPLAIITSPALVRGRSLAFEGVVNVTLRDDVSSTPLAATTVMGGGTQLAPFTRTFSFAAPMSSYGTLIFYERSTKDGSGVCATVERVRF